MTDQKNTAVDYLQGQLDRIPNSTAIPFVVQRLRRFEKKHGLTQDDIIELLGTNREGFVNLASCLEPADPSRDNFASLKIISDVTCIPVGNLIGLWSDEAGVEEVQE